MFVAFNRENYDKNMPRIYWGTSLHPADPADRVLQDPRIGRKERWHVDMEQLLFLVHQRVIF
jgi:hypothetical protein